MLPPLLLCGSTSAGRARQQASAFTALPWTACTLPRGSMHTAIRQRHRHCCAATGGRPTCRQLDCGVPVVPLAPLQLRRLGQHPRACEQSGACEQLAIRERETGASALAGRAPLRGLLGGRPSTRRGTQGAHVGCEMRSEGRPGLLPLALWLCPALLNLGSPSSSWVPTTLSRWPHSALNLSQKRTVVVLRGVTPSSRGLPCRERLSGCGTGTS